VVLIADYEEIRRRLGGDNEPPRCIIHRHNLVLGLCLCSAHHPRIYANPAEVWVEAGSYIEEWGERLAWDAGGIYLYVSPDPGRGFVEMGVYHVVGSTTERLELARRMAFPGIDKLSRIVFLSGPHPETVRIQEWDLEEDGLAE
jgi:hypothetical protein